MSGSNYTVSCKKCGAANTVRGRAMTLAVTCKSCQTYFRVGNWNNDVTKFANQEEPVIPIGSKGKIDGTVYEVMGFVVKKENKYHYSWREYLVFNPHVGYAFLSEYNGHWNFIWPIEDDPNRGTIDDEFFHGQNHFHIYQKYSAHVTYARGEFFFDVVDITESTVNKEYICPPYLFAVEKNEDSLLWCEGEYLTRQEVASAFNIPVSQLPPKSGIGYTQPISSSFKQKTLVKFSVVLLLALVAIQIFFSSSAEEKIVYQGRFNQYDLKDQKFFVTPSFELAGSSKSVEIGIEAPVNNDWFFGEFSLINEGTGIEYNFTKEIEYYHGVAEGESWSEGSTQGWAFVSEIPGGRYHLNIYPEFSNLSHEFSILVKRDVPMITNFFIAVAALAFFPAGYFIRKRYLEQRRWSDSEYSPYDS